MRHTLSATLCSVARGAGPGLWLALLTTGTGRCPGVVAPEKGRLQCAKKYRARRVRITSDSRAPAARATSGWLVNVEIEPKSTFAAPLAASPWARAAPSRARASYQPRPALGSRPASSAGFSCWAARQQEHDLRHVQRVVTAPLWLPSFGARDGNDPRHPLHRVGVLGSGGRHSPATSVGCPSLATVGVPSSRLLKRAHSEDFMICVCI